MRPVGRWLENGVGEDPAIVPGETREISDTYLDTEDWRIYQAGYALRIRRVKGKNRAEATMKLLASEGEAPGLRSRREISEPLDSPDPEAFDDDSGPVGKRIGALVGPKKLRTLFEIQTHRNTFGLILEGSEVGAVALDETNIPLENDAEPTHVRRVEIEVEPDAVLRLEPFVERLRYACRLSPASASKYEAGLFARASHRLDVPSSGLQACMTRSQPESWPSGFCESSSRSSWPTSPASRTATRSRPGSCALNFRRLTAGSGVNAGRR